MRSAGYLLIIFFGLGGLAVGPGCARVVPPTGGAKDTLAPKLVSTVPATGSVNYRGQTVVLEFSEAVQLNNILQQLIVSPVQDNPFTYKIRKKRVELTFSKPFPDSATIYLNFRAAVQDVTEKNTVPDLRLAFSTGPALDTLAQSGSVVDLFTGKPLENALVGLYPADSIAAITQGPITDTIDVRRQRPQYLTLTDKEGHYRLENLKAGRYIAATFSDKNGNSRWNGKTEPISFTPKPYVLFQDTALNFRLSAVDDEPPRLSRSQALTGAQVQLRFSEGLTNLIALQGKDSIPRQPTEANGSTYNLFLPKIWTDTLTLRLSATDSIGITLDTTVRVAPYKPARGKTDTIVTRAFRVQPEPGGGTALAPSAELRISLSAPVGFGIAAPTLSLQADSQAKRVPLMATYTQYRNGLTIKMPPYDGAQKHTIYLTPAAVTTAQGQPNLGDTLRFPVLSDEAVGLIRGEVASKAPHTVLELLNDRGEVLKTLRDAKTFEFTYLPPANYQLRLVLDANNNGRWDAGSYKNRRLPEAIIPPAAPIQVKANWEVEGILIQD